MTHEKPQPSPPVRHAPQPADPRYIAQRAIPTPEPEDIARIFRALGRLGVWQCRSCLELFEKTKLCAFGVCEECFTSNEDLDQVISIDDAELGSIYHLYAGWLADCHLLNRILWCSMAADTPEPKQLMLLHCLTQWVGVDKLVQAISTHGSTGRNTRILVRVDGLVWHKRHGFLTYELHQKLRDGKELTRDDFRRMSHRVLTVIPRGVFRTLDEVLRVAENGESPDDPSR